MVSLNSILANRESRRRPAGSRLSHAGTLGALSLIVVFTTACDSLLEVDLPGQLTDTDLDNPALAEVLVRSVRSDFDCAMSIYAWTGGLWANELLYGGVGSRIRLTQLRSREIETFVQTDCEGAEFPPVYLPFQTVRFTAEDAISRIGGFEAGSVADEDLLFGTLNAYAGYAYQILGEIMCEVTIDGGPSISRTATMSLAADRFTSAINLLSGSASVEAQSIVNMARVGRARSLLNRGLDPVPDASLVTVGFIRYAETDEINTRRENKMFTRINLGRDVTTIHTDYLNLMVGGVPDPRVPLTHVGLGASFDNVTDMWHQDKYPDRGTDVPFSTWREAQLMIAEFSGGAAAVVIINELRSNNAGLASELDDSAWPLPAYTGGGSLADVWEERRRELFGQGTIVGDVMRLDIPGVETDDFDTGFNQRGNAYGPHTCYPLPDFETVGNQNL